jgi:hypothetical protein
MDQVLRRGIAMGGKPYITVSTGHNRRLTFLHPHDYRRHRSGNLPRGYRPTLGQRRYNRAELRSQLTVLCGGKA